MTNISVAMCFGGQAIADMLNMKTSSGSMTATPKSCTSENKPTPYSHDRSMIWSAPQWALACLCSHTKTTMTPLNY